MRLIRMIMDTTIAAIESATVPDRTWLKKYDMVAAMRTATLRNVSAQTCCQDKSIGAIKVRRMIMI
jgi:hypothetical protein